MKKLTRSEAKYTAISYILGWANLITDIDEDYFEEIPENDCINKERCIEARQAKYFYPTKEEKELIASEAKKLTGKLVAMRRNARFNYQTQQIKDKRPNKK